MNLAVLLVLAVICYRLISVISEPGTKGSLRIFCYVLQKILL